MAWYNAQGQPAQTPRGWSSTVLIDQIKQFESESNDKQFTGTIRRIGRYYKFVK